MQQLQKHEVSVLTGILCSTLPGDRGGTEKPPWQWLIYPGLWGVGKELVFELLTMKSLPEETVLAWIETMRPKEALSWQDDHYRQPTEHKTKDLPTRTTLADLHRWFSTLDENITQRPPEGLKESMRRFLSKPFAFHIYISLWKKCAPYK